MVNIQVDGEKSHLTKPDSEKTLFEMINQENLDLKKHIMELQLELIQDKQKDQVIQKLTQKVEKQ